MADTSLLRGSRPRNPASNNNHNNNATGHGSSLLSPDNSSDGNNNGGAGRLLFLRQRRAELDQQLTDKMTLLQQLCRQESHLAGSVEQHPQQLLLVLAGLAAAHPTDWTSQQRSNAQPVGRQAHVQLSNDGQPRMAHPFATHAGQPTLTVQPERRSHRRQFERLPSQPPADAPDHPFADPEHRPTLRRRLPPPIGCHPAMLSAGLGGHWTTLADGERVWCPAIDPLRYPLSGSLSALSLKSGSHRTGHLLRTASTISPGERQCDTVSLASSGSVGQSLAGPRIERQWLETALDAQPDDRSHVRWRSPAVSPSQRPVHHHASALSVQSTGSDRQTQPYMHPAYQPDAFRHPEHSFGELSLVRCASSAQLPPVVERSAPVQPLRRRVSDANGLQPGANSTDGDIRIESPPNMTVIRPGKFQPYKEISKPFEMSDFYKYSTKFRRSATEPDGHVQPPAHKQ